MTVPDYQTLMRPLLSYAQDGGEKNIREEMKVITSQFNLTRQDLSELVPSGKDTLFANEFIGRELI
jgi:restriction system protein